MDTPNNTGALRPLSGSNASKNTLTLVAISIGLKNGFQVVDSTGAVYQAPRYNIHDEINDHLNPLEGRQLAFAAGIKWAMEQGGVS